MDDTARFTAIVTAHRAGAFLSGDTLTGLTLHDQGGLSIAWAPFEHVTESARLVVVGITPGRQQTENAFRAFHDALAADLPQTEALRRAKLTGAFSGPMRESLVAMLDHIGAQRAFGVDSCAELFAGRHDLAHLTSALRHPVFVRGGNYNGAPDMLRTPVLRQMVETHLAAEARALPHALWLPLGPKPTAALLHLAASGILERSRVLEGLPHPSGANGERIAYFLGRKARHALSAKTPAGPIDAARARLVAQVAGFVIPV